MQKIKVIINLTIKADRDDDDAILEAVTDKLTELIEAEELDFSIDDEDDSDE